MKIENDKILDTSSIPPSLRESEDRFRGIAENMADWIWEVNTEGVYTYCSKKVETILGYSINEIIGKTPFDFMCPSEIEQVKLKFLKYTKERKAFTDLENWNLTKEGKRICLRTSGTPIIDKNGNYLGYRGVDSDITERKNVEKELKTAKVFAESLLETANLIVVTLNTEAVITKFNSYAEDLTGFKREEVLGKNWFDLFIPLREREKIPQVFYELLKNMPNVVNYENLILQKNGQERLISWNNSVSRNDQGNINGILSIGTDITDRKIAEEELKKAKAEAEVANKAKSLFLANMSHELRTPLNAILGFGQLLELKQSNLDNQQIEYLENINQSGNHLLEMVNDILDLSKIESGRFEIRKKSINLSQLLLRLPKAVVPLAFNKNIKLIVDLDFSNEFIYADEKRLKQVIYNLLSNAIKFTAPGKKIGLKARIKADKAIIEVWDEGIGISKKDLDKIFDPFTQVGVKKEQGTGLGLSISKNLIELHKGTLIAHSKIDEGSHFIIHLPGIMQASDNKLNNSRVKDISVKAADGSTGNILVVEDDVTNQKVIEAILKHLGYYVYIAETGQKGIEAAKNKDFNLILMDIQLPGLDGIETMKMIRKQNSKKILIVALTAYAMDDDMEKYLSLGFDGYISKPIILEKLKESLDYFFTN